MLKTRMAPPCRSALSCARCLTYCRRSNPIGSQTTSFPVVYLVIEGRYKAHADDSLAIFSGVPKWKGWGKTEWHDSGFKYSAVSNFLNSMAAHPRVLVVKTWDEIETANWISATANWWAKPWHEHSSFAAWSGVTILGNPLSVTKPSLPLQFAAMLPGVGKDKAKLVAQKFKTIRAMVNSTVADWVGIRPDGKTDKGKAKKSITALGAKEILDAMDREHK